MIVFYRLFFRFTQMCDFTKFAFYKSVFYFCALHYIYNSSVVNKFIERIKCYIAQENILTPHCRVMVGLSGGADSVALLAILTHIGYDCVACHCNFMLRGKESMRDRDHAASTARQLNVPFVETSFDTAEYAMQKGISTEMAARELRYRWFETVRREYDAAAIAVAHHRDDNIETVLLNLIRGTGIAGVTGMKPRNGYIARPLLCVSRDELIEYLAHEQLHYVTDSTNLETLYTRNKLRLDIIPRLREINPSFDSGMERTIAHLYGSEKFYRESIENWRVRVCSEQHNALHIDLTQLHAAPDATTLLFEIVSPLGFNNVQIEDMATLGQPSGRQFLSPTHRAVSHREELIITPHHSTSGDDIVAVWYANDTTPTNGITLRYCDAQDFSIIRDKHVACFDLDCIKFPLTLRHWRKGDYFVPFGMHGRKKISDYFNDRKFSLIEKENILLLCDSEKILWIVGERCSNEARITPATARIVVIKKE